MTGSHEVRGSIPLGSTNHFHRRDTNKVSKMGSTSLICEIEYGTFTPDRFNFPPNKSWHEP